MENSGIEPLRITRFTEWEVGFLYYQQETGITTVVNFTSLLETRLVSRFFRRSSTTCVSSPYPAICQKDYSVTPR